MLIRGRYNLMEWVLSPHFIKKLRHEEAMDLPQLHNQKGWRPDLNVDLCNSTTHALGP